MNLTPGEIRRSYEQADKKDKRKQIQILAELNGSDVPTIRKILIEQGIDPRSLPRRKKAPAEEPETKKEEDSMKKDTGTFTYKSPYEGDGGVQPAEPQKTEAEISAGRWTPERLRAAAEDYRRRAGQLLDEIREQQRTANMLLDQATVLENIAEDWEADR